MRLFVAVPVPAEIRERAYALAKEIAQDGIVPVQPENMHLTLRFIGETDEAAAREISGKLGKVSFKAFSARIRGVGVFPKPDYVRVIWAGCVSGGALEALAKDVIGVLREVGGDERFSAHLTLARVKRKAELSGFLERHNEEDLGSFRVSAFQLIQSVLGPSGPAYTVIQTYKAEDADA